MIYNKQNVLDRIIVLMGIINITSLEAFALTKGIKGINGTCLSLSIAGISGIIGYRIHDVSNMLKRGKE